MVTNKAAFHVEQPAPARSWGLTPRTAQITCTFGTPTGHKVTAIIVESTMGEQVMVKAKGAHQRIWNGKEHQGASSK